MTFGLVPQAGITLSDEALTSFLPLTTVVKNWV